MNIRYLYIWLQWRNLLLITLVLLSVRVAGKPGVKDINAPVPFPTLTIMTEDYAPLSYVKEGQLVGFSVDVMAALLKNIGSTQTREDILLLPWARAYQITMSSPNTVLFSMSYTEHRDKLFKWVGPLMNNKVVVIVKKSRGLQVADIGDLSNLTVGTVRNDVGEQVLLEKGYDVSNIVSNNLPQNVVKMLEKDRIDAFVYGSDSASWYFQNLGLNRSEYVEVLTLYESRQYYAFNPATPQWIIDRFQFELAKLKIDGTYQKIAKKYPGISAGNY